MKYLEHIRPKLIIYWDINTNYFIIIKKGFHLTLPLRCLKHYSTIRTLKMVHYAYFHSAMMYGIIFCGNLIDSNKVFISRREL